MKPSTSLAAAALVASLAAPAAAAGICEARGKPEDAAVHVSGRITERAGSDVLTLRDDCGEILVLLPDNGFEACQPGATAEAIGAMMMGAVDASTVHCE